MSGSETLRVWVLASLLREQVFNVHIYESSGNQGGGWANRTLCRKSATGRITQSGFMRNLLIRIHVTVKARLKATKTYDVSNQNSCVAILFRFVAASATQLVFLNYDPTLYLTGNACLPDKRIEDRCRRCWTGQAR